MTTQEILHSIQYMVDEDGKKTAAVVQIEAWQQILNQLKILELSTKPSTDVDETLEQFVARIQARPSHPDSIIPAQGSLRDALRNPTYEDDDFDLEEWTKQWSAIEQEMQEITRQDDTAEGRI